MRNPNGYGSVIKLKGNRRRPYWARKTKGYNCKKQPIYQTIGYYQTKEEGMIALAEYNKNPYDIEKEKITLDGVFNLWMEMEFPKLGEMNRKGMKYAYKHCKKFQNEKYNTLRSYHMQDCVDNCGKGAATKGQIVNLWKHLDDLAYDMDIINKKYSGKLKSGKNPGTTRKPFSLEEINKLWEIQQEPWVDTVLFLIYSGWRINEFLNLETRNIDLEEKTMIGGLKTEAGKNRIVPIHSKILHIVKKHISFKNEYLFTNKGEKISLYKYYAEWEKIMKNCNMQHTPHECRHTFETLLDAAGANRKCIDLMMGHQSKDIGNRIYNHKTIQDLHNAIELVTK